MIIEQIIDFLSNTDRQLFLFLNGINSPFFDVVMWWLSQRLIWAPLYAILLILMWLTYRNKFWYILPLIILLVTLTDQISVIFFKDVFLRLRPCHEPSLEGMVRIVRDQCGGSYGFISSHATNTFGVAVFGGSLLGIRYKRAFPLLLLWAATVSYSRIYLGVHYPGDVIAGGLVGALLGWLAFLLFKWIIRERYPA